MAKSPLEFNNHFLNQIIYHSIKQTEFVKRIRNKIQDYDIFQTAERKHLARFIFEYFDQYKCAIGDNFYDEFKEKEKNLSPEIYNKCINLVGVLKDLSGSNWEYVADKIDEAIIHYKMEEASVDFAVLIKQQKYKEAKDLMLSALKTTSYEIEEPYFDFFEDKSYIEKRLSERKYKMKYNIPAIDKAIGGLNPSMLVNILGPSGQGKSWMLSELAINAVMQGLNVLYISLEMNKELVKERFDQTLGFMSSKDIDEKQERIKFKNGKWVKTKETINRNIFNISEVEKNTNRLRKSGGGLKVMAFNRGLLNYRDVEGILDELEVKEGYICDVLVVDYLGLMKKTEKEQNKKDKISENCLGLKEIAGRRNLIVLSAMQGNRAAMQAETFHAHMIADDIDTIFHSSVVLAMCQTKKEEREGKYRLYVAKNRHGKQHFSIGLIKDLSIGQIALGDYNVSEENTAIDTTNIQTEGIY